MKIHHDDDISIRPAKFFFFAPNYSREMVSVVKNYGFKISCKRPLNYETRV